MVRHTRRLGWLTVCALVLGGLLAAPATAASEPSPSTADATPTDEKFSEPPPDPMKIAEEELKKRKQEHAEFEATIPTALVMEELSSPRKTFILMRGDYTAPGEEVTADTPSMLPAMAADLPRNRLGLARWLVALSGVLIVLLIGFSRLYLGVHYPTDILAGYLSALLWLVCVGGVYALWLSVRGLRAAESDREGSTIP